MLWQLHPRLDTDVRARAPLPLSMVTRGFHSSAALRASLLRGTSTCQTTGRVHWPFNAEAATGASAMLPVGISTPPVI
jgi:hypothetical protein